MKFTAREEEILKHLSYGLRDKEMAQIMGITVKTVKFHMGNLLKKTGARNRVQLLILKHKGFPPTLPSSHTP